MSTNQRRSAPLRRIASQALKAGDSQEDYRAMAKQSLSRAEFIVRIFDIGLFDALESLNKRSKEMVRNLSASEQGRFGGVSVGNIIYDI